MHLVPKSRRPARRPFSYSPGVCRALGAIRSTHLAEEAKLDDAERLEFADALQVLAMAALIESQIKPTGTD